MQNMSRQIIVIAHDMRSCHNVGSLLRTCEGLGVTHVYFTGYTPYPTVPGDTRMPHEAAKLTKQIHKTALGSETMVPWTAQVPLKTVLQKLRDEQYVICGLEQASNSVKLPDYQPTAKTALLLGNEVTGIDASTLAEVTTILEIPMFGKKESFNVVQSAAMALFHLVFWGRS